MQNLDSLSLKFFCEENKDFLNGAFIQKIQMPSRYELIFQIRNNGIAKKMYVNINPKYPHIYFLAEKNEIKMPKTPPVFCMLLRKHLECAKIYSFNCVEYERILEFHFLLADEFGIEKTSVLAIELMGKHSNIILYNGASKIILGAAHTVSKEKSSVREIYGGIKYIYPPKQNKLDIMKQSYLSFAQCENQDFFYFTKPFIEFLKSKTELDKPLFNLMQESFSSSFLLKEYLIEKSETRLPLNSPINSIIFNYYSKIAKEDLLLLKKNKLIKILYSKLKKINFILEEKFDFEKYNLYKKSGDLIFQYIYLIEPNSTEITLEDIKINLNPNLSPAQNAQKYYKLYSKLKSAKNASEKRKKEAQTKKQYYEEVLFLVKNAGEIETLEEIEEEIEIKKINQELKKPKIESFLFEGFKILLGKNNKQNDFIIKKMSNPNDIWLHALGEPSGHVIIKTDNGKNNPPESVLVYAAKLVKENSPSKNANKASVIYTKRKFIKRPPDTPYGYVTYQKESEIVV